MAVLTADRNRKKRGIGRISEYPLAAVKIFKGAIVHTNAAGFATNGSDTAAQVTLGVAYEQVDNAAGVAGDKRIRVESDAEWLFAASSITQAMVGTNMATVDNDTVDDAAGPVNDVVVGKLTEFVSVTQGWVNVPGLTI